MGYNSSALTSAPLSPPPSSSRIATFDLLRGLFLVIIVIDHINRFPSIFEPITGRGALWVSAAEGFFFISGALIMIIKGRQAARSGLRVAWRSIWARAGTLYLASVVLVALMTVVATILEHSGIKGSKGGFSTLERPFRTAFDTLTLGYQYGWADFLAYYCVFLFIAPLVLWLLLKRWWIPILAISSAIYAVNSFYPLGGWRFYAAWQLYFFSGMVFGHLYPSLQAWYRRPGRARRTIILAVSVTALITFSFSSLIYAARNYEYAVQKYVANEEVRQPFYKFAEAARTIREAPAYYILFEAERTGILRPVAFVLWFAALQMAAVRFRRILARTVGRVLVPLGERSLYVYILESFIIFAVAFLPFRSGLLINSILHAAVIALLWLAVRYRFLFKVIPN